MRRLVDVVVSGLAGVVLSPVMAAVAALVRLKLGRPVIFRQRRIGLKGRAFDIVKFRTMRPEAWPGEPDAERDTALGRTLRGLSLDELPQLWNVLRGDMSLIGPRPTLPEQVEHYSPRQHGRHAIRPGLTGWAQVNGRNSISWPERIELDLWYIEHRSLALDMSIVGRTVQRLLRPAGIYGEGGVNQGFPVPGVATGDAASQASHDRGTGSGSLSRAVTEEGVADDMSTGPPDNLAELAVEPHRRRAQTDKRRRIVERVETLTAAYWRWMVLRRARDRTASVAGRSCVVVAPHPDDETFACGALIARKLAVGTSVHVLVLTDGGASHPGVGPEKLASVRRAELARACHVLGLGPQSVRQLDYPDGRLAEHIHDASEVLSQTIREFRPDEVLVSSHSDGHPDHVAASSAVRAALQLTPGPDLIEYPVWSWYRGPLVAIEGRARTLRLLTDVVRRLLVPPAGELVAVEHHLEVKSHAIQAYRSQLHGYGESGVGPTMPTGFVDLFLASHEVFFRNPTSR